MMRTNEGKNSKINRTATVLFVISYALHAVDSPLPGVKIGDFVLAIASAMFLMSRNSHHLKLQRISVYLVILFYAFCLLTGIDLLIHRYIDIRGILVRNVRWIFYIISACTISQEIDKEYFFHCMVVIALLGALVLFLQVIVYSLTKYPISFTLLGEEIGYSGETLLGNGLNSRIHRFSAFFSEPAHFAYFESLALAFLVLLDNFPQAWGRKCAFLITSAMLLSTSTYAIALLGVITTCFLLKKIRRQTITRFGAIAVILLPVATIGMFFFLQDSSLAAYAVAKFRNIGVSSRTTFIWNRGIDFSALDILLGCGVGNEEYYVLQQYGVQVGYLSSPSLAFLYGGIAGLSFSLIYIFCVWGKLDKNGRIPFLLLLVISVFSTAFFSATMVLFTVAAVATTETPSVRRRTISSRIHVGSL